MNTRLDRTIKTIAIHTQSFANVIQKELADTGFEKNLPLDLVLDMVNTIMKQEIGKKNVSFGFSEPSAIMKTASKAETPVSLPVSNKGSQLTLQLKPSLSRSY